MSQNTNSRVVPKEMMAEIAAAYNLEFPDNFYKLLSFFSHHDWLMRKTACEYTFKLGERAVPLLYEALMESDVSDDLAYWGVRCLSRFGAQANEALCDLLKNAGYDNNKLIYVLKAISYLKINDAVPPLIECLGHKNWIIRKEASAAMLSIGKSAVPLLKDAFTSGNKDIRYWTVRLLSQILGREAVDSFKKLLASDKKDLRYYALTALGEIEGEDINAVILSCLGDSSWLVRAQAAEILEKRGRSVIKSIKKAFMEGSSDVKYWAIKVLAKILKEEALEFLKKAVESEDAELKFCVIDALAQMNFKKAAPVLAKFFDDPAWLVRKHAASVFEKFGNQAAEFLSSMLFSEENENIRYWAVQIISRSDEKYFMKMIGILDHPGRPERIFIIQALRETRNAIALPALFRLLADPQWTVRREAAQTIIEFGADICVPYMIESVDIKDKDSEYWAQKIMTSFGDQAAAIVIKQIKLIEESGESAEDNKKLDALYRYLVLNGGSRAVEAAISIFKGKQNGFKEALVKAAAVLKNENMVKGLLKALDSEDAGVCFWIARVLNSISKNLYHCLYEALDGKIPEKRVWVCKIFGEIKDRNFISPLVMLLSDPDKNVRYEATKVLSKFETDEVFEFLIKQFIDEDEEGRICIIENIHALVNEKMVERLIDSFDESSDTDSYWISKLIVETAKDHMAFIEKKYEKSIDASRVKYWLKKIIDHMKGVNYL